MPIYSFKCEACGETSQETRTIEARGASGKCRKCGKPTAFTPFGSAPATHFSTDYHRQGSSDGRAWDHILGASAAAGHQKMAEQFRRKNKIVADGGAAVFRQDKGSYRPATGFDIPQIVTNRIGATHPGVKDDIKAGRTKNDVTAGS